MLCCQMKSSLCDSNYLIFIIFIIALNFNSFHQEGFLQAQETPYKKSVCRPYLWWGGNFHREEEYQVHPKSNGGLQSCTHYLMNQFVDSSSYLQSNIFDKVCISKPCSLSKLVVSHIMLH